MLVLKIYLIITWLFGIAVGLYGKRHWNEINHDGKFNILNPDWAISLIVISFPILLPICFILEIFDKNDY